MRKATWTTSSGLSVGEDGFSPVGNGTSQLREVDCSGGLGFR